MKGTLLKNEPLSKYTSWQVGGPAKQMYLPAGKADLISFVGSLPKQEKIYWLGLGSNLLVRDGGIYGTVINTRKRLKTMHLLDTNKVYVEAGVPCTLLARFCAKQGLSGAEFLAGIPGTVGGALKMNAGAFGGEIWNIVDNVEMLNAKGQVNKRRKSQFTIAYRTVKGKQDEWFLAVELLLKIGITQTIRQKTQAILKQRMLTQPTNKPTCGSVFKNPPQHYAAKLIQDCNLKGYAIGGAMVSQKHANFIENTGQATASDIEKLIHYVQQQVKKNYNVTLEMEACKVGQLL